MSKVIKVRVSSETVSNVFYNIEYNTESQFGTCECLGFQGYKKCKHLTAVRSENSVLVDIMNIIDTHIMFGNSVVKTQPQIIDVIKGIKFSGNNLRILNKYRHYIVGSFLKKLNRVNFNKIEKNNFELSVKYR
jgi:hypothetical protein